MDETQFMDTPDKIISGNIQIQIIIQSLMIMSERLIMMSLHSKRVVDCFKENDIQWEMT